MRPSFAIIFLWALFALSWLVAAWWSAPTDKQIGFRAEIPYRVVLLIGGLIFAIPARGYHGPLRLWYVTLPEAWICVAFIAIGFAFCWWGRIYLGPLWSGNVTRKDDHRVVDTGPYAIVRHPIYTGVLIAVLATCVAKGTVWGIVGAVIIAIGLWMKARLEEHWLSKELDPGSYHEYRRRVSMLVPWIF
jgi:protein-S-isoprenylcysteine O-methyltransferase Ste14